MIYFDNAATTKVLPCAVKAAAEMLQNNFGNPSSLHTLGLNAEKTIETTRSLIALAAGVQKEEIYFSQSGTMANNTAIKGFLANKRGGRVITTAFEHPSVLECFKGLKEPFEVVYLKPENGIITPKALENALTDDTIFISIMHVNNETGALSPLKQLSEVIKKSGIKAVFHTDAVQGFLKEDFNYSIMDMASFSGHKNHAPKGIGVLYIKKGLKIHPIISGGGQEKNLFSSTQNTPAIAAWGAAVKELSTQKIEFNNYVLKIKSSLYNTLYNLGGEIISPEDSSPYILNAAFKGYQAENLLHYLSQENIYISTGSACSSKKGSHVIKSIGRDDISRFCFRISLSHLNTEKEVQVFSGEIEKALKSLIKI